MTIQSLVDKYQSDNSIFLFLMCTKAEGFGLNLTAANKAIIFDVSAIFLLSYGDFVFVTFLISNVFSSFLLGELQPS
jgi:hypothetical protein